MVIGKKEKDLFELFNSISHPIVVTNEIGIIHFSNDEFSDLCNLPNDMIHGINLENIFPEEQKKNISSLLALARSQKSSIITRSQKSRLRRKSRRTIPVLINLSKRFIENQNYLIFSLSDVSQLESIEKAKAEHQKEIDRLSRLHDIGRLSFGIAHELNNPLQIILSNTEDLIEACPEDKKLTLHAKTIGETTERMSQIISNMSDIISQRKLKLQNIQVGHSVENSIKYLSKLAKENNVEITVHKSCYREIFANQNLLEQVFINLIKNSIDSFSKNQKVKKISISATEKGNSLLLHYSNNGRVVTSEEKEKMFNPFYSTKKVGEGSGLGLFLSFWIIEALGGNLTFDYSTEQETKFSFSLPYISAQESSKVA